MSDVIFWSDVFSFDVKKKRETSCVLFTDSGSDKAVERREQQRLNCRLASFGFRETVILWGCHLKSYGVCWYNRSRLFRSGFACWDIPCYPSSFDTHLFSSPRRFSLWSASSTGHLFLHRQAMNLPIRCHRSNPKRRQPLNEKLDNRFLTHITELISGRCVWLTRSTNESSVLYLVEVSNTSAVHIQRNWITVIKRRAKNSRSNRRFKRRNGSTNIRILAIVRTRKSPFYISMPGLASDRRSTRSSGRWVSLCHKIESSSIKHPATGWVDSILLRISVINDDSPVVLVVRHVSLGQPWLCFPSD